MFFKLTAGENEVREWKTYFTQHVTEKTRYNTSCNINQNCDEAFLLNFQDK
jgi:hypothetical protein